MSLKILCVGVVLAGLSLFACQTSPEVATQEAESQAVNQFFEKAFNESVELSPQGMSFLGIKKDYDKLDDISEAHDQQRLELDRKHLLELQAFAFDKLDKQTQLSYLLFKNQIEDRLEDFTYRYNNFPVNQMFGIQADLPSFLINIHRIDSESDAIAYISRLRDTKRLFDQLLINLQAREAKGIIPPKFVFAKVLSDSSNVISGRPFARSQQDSTLQEDFTRKVRVLKLPADREKVLLEEARQALLTSVLPAYTQLISFMQNQEKRASTKVGAWTLPDGKQYYKVRLKRMTTTDLTAETVHKIGLDEVARIQREMSRIQQQLEFKGTLQDFFAFLKKENRFYYPQTAAGRDAYLKDTRSLLTAISDKMPSIFGILPKDKLQVKAVETFREKSAEIGFYNSPAMDGSRPGIFYVNLWDMRQVPKYEMEALTYHEGIPGHHLQLSIAQQLKDLPKFRRFGGYTAYVEGWGLYSETLPKEYGFYKDPYSDFGRLTMELWRACRLVVDTGIHAQRWSRDQGIAYLEKNTPADHGEIVKAVERYIVMPGQATAYKIGMLKILELRREARQQLGKKFDIRDFHDQILKNGPLPLQILEQEHKIWLASQKI